MSTEPSATALRTALEAAPPVDRIGIAMEFGKQLHRSSDGDEWVAGLDAACVETGTLLTLDQRRVVASDLAWWARQRRDDDQRTDRSPTPDDSPWSSAGVGNLIIAQYLRFDFRFDALDRYLRQVGTPDAMARALQLFSRYGTGRQVSHVEVDEIRALPDADEKTLHCLLHGMCIAPDPRPWADEMVEIANELERIETRPGGVLFYRRAIAHRLRGNLDAADTDMRRALSLVPPDNSVHQQFTMELALIAAEHQRETQLAEREARLLARLETAQEETIDEIDDRLRTGLIANFQILGLALTLATFLGTAGFTVIQVLTDKVEVWRGIVSVAVLLVFIFLVFLGSRILLTTRLGRKRT